MEYYLILARSVTYAQRIQRALERAGIRCRIFRAPRDVADLGCAYAVRILHEDLSASLIVIHREGLGPVRVFLESKAGWQEVRHDLF